MRRMKGGERERETVDRDELDEDVTSNKDVNEPLPDDDDDEIHGANNKFKINDDIALVKRQ